MTENQKYQHMLHPEHAARMFFQNVAKHFNYTTTTTEDSNLQARGLLNNRSNVDVPLRLAV
jgi:hypothetical protein